MSELATKSLTTAEIRVILAEVLRRELRGIFDEQTAILRPTDAQIEARIEELQKEINKLRRDARRDDFQAVEYEIRNAALAASVALPETIEPALGRKAMDLVREIRTAQIQIEDGEEATRVVEPLVAVPDQRP